MFNGYIVPGKFDLIECRHVLEQVEDGSAVLTKMADLLKQNGGISLTLNAG